ncbi:glycosyltransferase [Aerococcaceae bacterium DSM 111020]|nr:glycosyltransferase [Aerococcaceae bacterium DSM 111020]
MRILLYSEHLDQIKKSGLGKAIKHQMKALELAGINYTLSSKDDYDVLHINTYFPQSYQFAKQAKAKGKAIVYHAHSTEEDFRNSFRFSNMMAPYFKKWLIKCYQLGDVLVTPTNYSKELLENYGFKQPIHAISNGIDLTQFTHIPNAQEKFLQKYPQYTNEDFIVMGIGLYLERKGILDFVQLAKDLPEVQFIWFGYTNPKMVPPKIEEAIQTQLPNLYFAGYVDNVIIQLALQGTDWYIFPTYEETEGIPAIEAAAVGANFIVRDIPVFDHWLIDRVNVYKAKDYNDFKHLIIQAYQKVLPNLSDAAYQVANERSLERIGQQLGDVYQQALKINQQKKNHTKI